MPSVVAGISTMLVVTMMLFMGWFIIDSISTSVTDLEEPQLLPEGYLKGTVQSLSSLEDETCNLILENDLNMYTFHNVIEGEWEVLETAKVEGEEITIYYDVEDMSLEEVGTNIEIPEPPEESFDIPWWLFAIPVGIVVVFYVIPRVGSYALERHQWRKEHKEELETKKREIEEKRRQNEDRKQKQRAQRERQQYQKEGRTSRTAKAAQLLDQQEGKKRRK